MANYAELPSEIEILAGLVHEFDSKLCKLKELTSQGKLIGSISQINEVHHQAISLSKKILTTITNIGKHASRNHNLQYSKLTKEFQSSLKQLDELTKTALNNQKEIVEEDKQIIDNEIMDLKIVGDFSDVALIERREEVLELEKDMILVNSMYKDISKMIIDQGIMLNEAKKNADTAAKETDKVVENLEKAENLQRSAKDKLICICIIIAIVMIIIILAILGYLYI